MARRFALAVATLGVVLTRAPRASANPLDTFGFGSRAAAMGGAVAADVQDFSASYYNPAGLVRAKGLDVSLGYFRADHFLAINGNDTHVDPVKGLVGGLAVPGKVASLPVAFGLAVHIPDDRLSRVRAVRQEQPRWELYDNRNQRLFFAANVAVSPWPFLQLGGGVSFMAATTGRLDISGSANIFRPLQSQMRHEVDAELTAIRYPQAGARVALGKRAALALVYRGEFKFDLKLDAYLHGDISGLTTAVYDFRSRTVNAFLPQQVVLGGAFLPHDDVHVNLDFTWMNWSAYIPPVSRFAIALDIPPPAGGWPAGIAPPQAPAPTRVVDMNMKDRLVPHLGLEWRALASAKRELFVRGGYELSPSPLPPQRGVTNYVDRDRHTFSLGAGVRLVDLWREVPGDVRLDAHAQLHVLPSGTTLKDDPADTTGDFRAGGHVWSVGATLSLGFR